ncbi:MAG: hypothetical protein LBF72_00450 [Holosporales bacterium]|nr:hypothetical protein [Holosporales bacterium]
MLDGILEIGRSVLDGVIAFFTWLKECLASIPLFIYLAFAIGIIFAVCAILLINNILKKQAQPSPAKEKTVNKYKVPPIGGFISEFFVKKGIFKVGRMSSHFLYSLDFLEETLKSSDFKYKKPWFLVLGAKNSGKTTFIRSFSSVKAPWQEELGGDLDTECNWSFLVNGIGLDIKGELFLHKDKVAADEIGWNAVVNLLSRYRSGKPIDSIVLTISAEDLYGKNRIPQRECVDRARYIAKKLSAMQNVLGLRIPVYVVISKTDVIPGFKDFCKNIPASAKNQMFGWANPYKMDAAYLPQWVDEALEQITNKIIDVSMDISCSDALSRSADSLFVFPYELEKIKSSLSLFMDQIFKSDSYSGASLLRGIFIVGDSGLARVNAGAEHDRTEFIEESLLQPQYSLLAATGTDALATTASSSAAAPLPAPEVVGAAQITTPAEQAALAESGLLAPDILECSERLFFCKDIINSKVLEEYSLCVPQKSFLLTANKALRIAKFSTFAFMFIGSIGFYSAYKTLSKSRRDLMPMIHSMYGFLVSTQQIPLTELSQKNEAFEGAIKQLSGIMQSLAKAKLSSLFIPPSWFSPLRKKLNSSINLAYQNLIMRALYVNLLLKARELLRMSPSEIKPNSSIVQLAIPTKSNEFRAMFHFVTKLTELSTFVDKFNELRVMASPKVITELADYAFGITLSESFVKHYGKMRHKLDASAFPEIDLFAYKGLARKTLEELFQEFFNTVFITSGPRSFPAILDLLIRQLRNLDAKGLPDVDFMRKLSLDMNASIKFLEKAVKTDKVTGLPEAKKADPEKPAEDGAGAATAESAPKGAAEGATDGAAAEENIVAESSIAGIGGVEEKLTQTWMDKEVFEPGPEFEKFLCMLDKSPFFGPDVSQTIVNNCAVGLFHLRQSLRDLTKLLTTDVRFEQDKQEDDDIHCSAGFVLLAKSLKALFEETYMRRPSSHRFIDKVPDGQTLYWDDKLLKVACELCKQYEAFSTRKIGSFPVILQESFRLLARDSLQRNVISLMAQAQNFIQRPTFHNDAVVEEHVRSKAANIRTVTPQLLKLLELLNYESVSFFYVSLRDLLSETNYALLTQINDLMKKMGPYHIWDPSFSWWDGKKCPVFQAYGVKDVQDLNSFLDMQSSQVINLALNLAKPVVDLLTSNIMLSVSPLDNAKLAKWRRIVAQAEAFQKKQPGNSIAELESFITTTFKEYTTDNAFEKINIQDANAEVGDHFLETKQHIQKGILGRAEILRRQQSISNYNDLADFFNTNLRGHFPFLHPSQDQATSAEVDPEDLRLFLEGFKKAGGSAEKILDQVHQLGLVDDAMHFLREIEQIYELFSDFLEAGIGSLPFIKIDVHFNVNRERAAGANLVAEWGLQANRDEEISDSDKVKQTKWVYDCPIMFGFRWPSIEGFTETPFNDPRQPSLKVIGKTAAFEFGGKWSLFRLIRKHRANPGEYPVAQMGHNAIVLKFVVPIGENKSAVLFNSISLLGASMNPNLPGKALALPEFPILAPALSEEIERYRNEPVLSFQVLQAQPTE